MALYYNEYGTVQKSPLRRRSITARRVKGKHKLDNRIVAVCGDWGSVHVAVAAFNINALIERYYIKPLGGERAYLEVVEEEDGVYLRAVRDDSSANNLGSLPECLGELWTPHSFV